MADTGSSKEADAVLSSVRKIVASGPQQAISMGNGPLDSSTDKLLLTPSLRVDAPQQSRETPTFFHSPRRYSTLENRIAELERAVTSRDDSWEPDGSETTDEETPSSFVFSHERADKNEYEDEGGNAPADILGHDAFDAAFSEPDEPVANGTSFDVPSVEAPAEAECDEPSLPMTSSAPHLSALVDESDVLEAAFDEEALRKLVSQLVREELQGELGEKITRNVRKLVRREIHRVILTHDFG